MSESPSGIKKNDGTNNNNNNFKSNKGDPKSKKPNNDKNTDQKQKRKRGNRQQNPTEKLSRALTWALRHQGPSIGLSMTPDGYVPVSQLLSSKHPKLAKTNSSSWTLEDIEAIVKTSDKQRFQLDQRPAKDYPGVVVEDNENKTTILCLRATQGHSLKFIDSDLLLMPVTAEELATIPTIVHGTYQQAWSTGISKDGLKRMNRNHIHCAAGLPQDQEGGVISGMRKTCDVYIYVSGARCAANPSIQFYRSNNGVLLTAGVDGKGTLPVEYFSLVTDPQGTILLDQRGPPMAATPGNSC